jgi:hypothetical protein
LLWSFFLKEEALSTFGDPLLFGILLLLWSLLDALATPFSDLELFAVLLFISSMPFALPLVFLEESDCFLLTCLEDDPLLFVLVDLLLVDKEEASLGATVGAMLGESLGATFDESLGAMLGDPLGESLGARLGEPLGATLGESLGAEVGVSLGAKSSTGGSVGDVVGSTVTITCVLAPSSRLDALLEEDFLLDLFFFLFSDLIFLLEDLLLDTFLVCRCGCSSDKPAKVDDDSSNLAWWFLNMEDEEEGLEEIASEAAVLIESERTRALESFMVL